MPKNEILENITIDKLIFWGKGLGVTPDGRKVIISGGVIPGSIVNIRVLKARKSHYEGQVVDIVKKSPLEIPLPEGFQMYGWAKWLTIDYPHQLEIKSGQVREAFHSLRDYVTGANWNPIIASPEIYGYRNKVEFSFGKYISAREWVHDEFRFGFHVQGQFDRIEDCRYCALADEETNTIFQTVDTLTRASGLPTYDPHTGEGIFRHFVVRKAKKSGEIMLIFSVNSIWEGKSDEYGTQVRDFFTDMVRQLTEKYPHIVSVYFLENTGKADIVTGNLFLLSGKTTITEELLGLAFEIQPKSFFQVNTLGAEKLYGAVIDALQYKGASHKTKESENHPSIPPSSYPTTLLDLYAGTGTIGILLSKYFSEVYSVELVSDASGDGEKNAIRNGVHNVRFVNAKVEDFAREFASQWHRADSIVLDPPRDGMHPSALPNILVFGAREIIYVSCNPATLARDLEVFVGKSRDEKTEKLPKYQITDITPVDMFPHTHHIETIVRLEKL